MPHTPLLPARGLLAAALALVLAGPPVALAKGGGPWKDAGGHEVVEGPALEQHLELHDDVDAWEDEEEDQDLWFVEEDEETGEAGDEPAAAPTPAPRKAAPAPAPARRRAARAAKVPYGSLIASTARRRGVPVALFTALVWQESAFKPRARSSAGARGLTQLMPATARMLGVRRIYDPRQNLDGGARYLRDMLRQFRSKRLALAAYNAGPGAVRRFKGVPPYAETRRYVSRILTRERQLRRQGVR